MDSSPPTNDNKQVEQKESQPENDSKENIPKENEGNKESEEKENKENKENKDDQDDKEGNKGEEDIDVRLEYELAELLQSFGSIELLEQMKKKIKRKKLTDEEKQKIKEDKYKTIIEKLKSNSFKNIIFLTGAGISTSAGIPDFRSKNGLFQQLQEKYNLSRPEEFFDIHRFYESPEYFYEFTKNFSKQKYTPTPFHYFMGFMDSKKLVRYIFTQNIDGLELKSGIDENKIIFAHGNFIQAHCPKCQIDIDRKLFDEKVEKGEILYCEKCGTPCKSKVVFYGEGLPSLFFEKMPEMSNADLIIISGTSLVVGPFNMLPYHNINEECWRVVINKEKVGQEYGKCAFDYDHESKDLLIEGYSDEIIKKIVKECGWEEEFAKFIEDVQEKNKE